MPSSFHRSRTPADPGAATRRPTHRRGLHPLPLLWAAGGVAAVVLTLGVNGTLSAWTSAVIVNSTDSVATANAVILKEVGPDGTAAHTAQTFYSSSGTGNSYSCGTINKYGGITSPLSPGGSQVTDVTFTNAGAASGATFKLDAGACSQTPTAGTGTPAATDLCATTGELTVAVSCSNGATYTAGSAWTDLVYAAGKPSTIGSLTHTATLAANVSWTCRFTVALSSTASVQDQGIVVTQPLTWTLAQ